MADSVTKLAYQTMQQGKSLLGIAHKQISTQLMELVAPKANAETVPITAETLQALRRSMDNLLERDWLEAEQGLYPTSQLFDAPWLDWMLRYPLVWLDLPKIWDRRLRRDVHDLPAGIDSNSFPNYYLQNFHHQTDGYLSDRSAELYDLQVEILFNGTADAMRRRILKPLTQRFKQANLPATQIKILDVACGTGRTLTWADTMNAASAADVTFIGERHDDPTSHQVQLAVYEELLAGYPRCAISLEHLERNEQALTDQFLASAITMDAFIDQTNTHAIVQITEFAQPFA